MKPILVLGLYCAIQSPSFAAVSAVKKIVTGTNHSCALLDNGKIKCWGRNDDGQLGTGNQENYGRYPETMGAKLPAVNLGNGIQAQDVCAGFSHSCARLADGSVKCWGSNESGQLGRDAEGNTLSPEPVPLGDGVKVTALSCGNQFTCATTEAGQAKCWGDNQFGQLGIGSAQMVLGRNTTEMGSALPYVMLGKGSKIKSLKAGSGHACALLENGGLKCWGGNGFGQLGYGDTILRGIKPEQMGDNLPYVDLGKDVTLKEITLGAWHSCGLTTDGKIKCWGINDAGNLGIGNTVNRGNTAKSMGDALPYVLLGTFDVAGIYANGEHTCAKGTDSSIKCWGLNDYGQLGAGDSVNRGRSQAGMSDTLRRVSLALPVKAIAEGKGYHTCALLINSLVKCWGKNFTGQLGYNDDIGRGTSSGDMGEFLPFIELQ